MTKTDDWTTRDLIKYLVSIQSKQSIDFERFQSVPIFPKEATGEQETNEDGTAKMPPRFKVADLHQPLGVFRKLDLPIIDWEGNDGKHKWRSNSREGIPDTVWPLHMLIPSSPAKFLFSLGLVEYPTEGVLMNIAAKGGLQGEIALNYLLDNSKWWYSDTDYGFGHYDSSGWSIAFVPAVQEGKRKLAIPWEVYSNLEWQSLGFATLDPSLRWDAASKLEIAKHPSAGQICSHLNVSRPATEAQAQKWFKILSSQLSGVYNL